MFLLQSLGVECEVCLSHAGGSEVTKPFLVTVESAIAKGWLKWVKKETWN